EDHSSSSSEEIPLVNDPQRRRQPPTWMQEYESGEDLPHGAKKVGVKWVYKTKYNENGEVEKYKARLVAKGYSQTCGIDYTEVFAPVACLETVRLVISLAAQNDWVLFQLDVKSAFLHGELSEEVFIDQPHGYIKKGAEQKVYRLKKALYGLKQAPRAWYSQIESYFTKEGFKRCPYEHTLFVKAGEGGCQLTRDEKGVTVDNTRYKQLIGSLMYLTGTRPDIMYVVSKVAKIARRSRSG
nr:retrovirus-related Pol polyprotein from transposon TNT 1-94 [Tanacetum cinerariifolium]